MSGAIVGSSSSWFFDSRGPRCHFCKKHTAKLEPGIKHEGIEMCGECIDKAREIAGRK